MRDIGRKEIPGWEKYVEAEQVSREALDSLEISLLNKPTHLAYRSITVIARQAQGRAFMKCDKESLEFRSATSEWTEEEYVATFPGIKRELPDNMEIVQNFPTIMVWIQNPRMLLEVPAGLLPSRDKFTGGKKYEVCDVETRKWYYASGDSPDALSATRIE